jgi:prophage regulatory protein
MVRVMPYTDDRLLRRREVEAMVGFGRSMIYEKMASGAFPQPLKIGPKSVRWREQDICAWIDRLPKRPAVAEKCERKAEEPAWLAADRRETSSK